MGPTLRQAHRKQKLSDKNFVLCRETGSAANSGCSAHTLPVGLRHANKMSAGKF